MHPITTSLMHPRLWCGVAGMLCIPSLLKCSGLGSMCADGSDQWDSTCGRATAPPLTTVAMPTPTAPGYSPTNTPRDNGALPNLCPPGFWQCRTSGGCITVDFLCDGSLPADCSDGSDEAPNQCRGYVRPSTAPKSTTTSTYFDALCGANRWSCGDKACIPLSFKCDGFPDCTDETDEKPELCRASKCPKNYWECADGQYP